VIDTIGKKKKRRKKKRRFKSYAKAAPEAL